MLQMYMKVSQYECGMMRLCGMTRKFRVREKEDEMEKQHNAVDVAKLKKKKPIKTSTYSYAQFSC